MSPRLLDLFCGAGGCSAGYAAAGFDVTGIDIEPHPDYPFTFVQADVMDVLSDADFLGRFDVFAASPPCQAFTNAQKIRGNTHPDFIAPTRVALEATGKPYAIENVPGSPLRNPVELCGAMFGLRTYRHRLFESNVALSTPAHPEHVARTTKMGRPPRDGEFMHVVGNFSGVAQAREAMGIDWMTRDDLREAVPPRLHRAHRPAASRRPGRTHVMTILYDGHGAVITSTVHELDDQSHTSSSYTQPGESYVRCVCGWEGESIASIAGGAIPPGVLFRGHLDDVDGGAA